MEYLHLKIFFILAMFLNVSCSFYSIKIWDIDKNKLIDDGKVGVYVFVNHQDEQTNMFIDYNINFYLKPSDSIQKNFKI